MTGRLWVLAVAAAVVLASCGDDDTEGPGTSAGMAGVFNGPDSAGADAGGDGGDAGADAAGGQGGEGGVGASAGLGGEPNGGAGETAGAGGGATEEPEKPPVESCAAPEDESRWASGNELYVGVNSECGDLEPCYPSIFAATYEGAAKNGDTIILLPGKHGRDIVYQTEALRELRITSLDRDTTSIEGGGLLVFGQAGDAGELWIERLTFRNSGPAQSSSEEGWGIHVSGGANTDVRIHDNVFEGHTGRGGLGLESSNGSIRFHATVARNVFRDNAGPAGALLVDVPWNGKDYCFRIENNLFVNNNRGVSLAVATAPIGEDPIGTFEVVNNTIVRNRRGLTLPTSGVTFVTNNILFDNEEDLHVSAELGHPATFRNNLIGSGQFSGLRGNFAADPRFVDADNDDFRLGDESPAAARATVLPAPDDDIDGIRRGYYVDLGAYERAATPSSQTSGLACGDGQVQWGPTDTTRGTFLGFETCDDGNQVDGDGCSAFCQREASASEGRLSFFAGNLCVVRKNGALDCWGGVASATPSGSFAQVATNQYYACALRSDGSVTCWLKSGSQGAYVPAGKFTSIASDGTQTCGLRAVGGVSCWTDDEQTLSEDGSFARIATAGAFRVCALSADGADTCWEPYDSFPQGPFVQIFPDRYGGCGLSSSGVLSCLPDINFFVDIVPDAAFQRVSISGTVGLGIRPDGRVAQWRINEMELPPEAQQRPFIDVVGGDLACGLTADDKVYCWNAPVGYPQE